MAAEKRKAPEKRVLDEADAGLLNSEVDVAAPLANEAPLDNQTPTEHQIEILVPKGETPERADVYLARMLPKSSRTVVQAAITAKAVTVNGTLLDRPSYKIKGGDCFHITIPKPPPLRAEAEDIPLNIIFEDDEILIVNKPAGMVVHPAVGSRHGTLVNALLHHIKDLQQINPGRDPERPGIVHRLDKDTSGLLVVAKSTEAHRNLAKQFFHHTARRVYNAIVWGNFKERFGRIETLIGRHPTDRKRFVVRDDDGKLAITEFFVVEEFPGFSLVELRLQTGRTHQIRVHMQHLGHPVFGDATYSGRALNVMRSDIPQWKHWVDLRLHEMPRQALHAKSLQITHPKSNQLMEWSTELPEDMQTVLNAMHKLRDKLG